MFLTCWSDHFHRTFLWQSVISAYSCANHLSRHNFRLAYKTVLKGQMELNHHKETSKFENNHQRRKMILSYALLAEFEPPDFPMHRN